jgi:hypothetical protein
MQVVFLSTEASLNDGLQGLSSRSSAISICMLPLIVCLIACPNELASQLPCPACIAKLQHEAAFYLLS